jgi:hypothetical protein
MKTKICILSLMLAASLPAWGTLYQSGNLAGTVIPDNNTIGTGNTLTYTPSPVIDPGGNGIVYMTGLTLSFTLQGGVSTDLSGYLRLGNTTGSPSYNLSSIIQNQSLSGGSPVTYTVDFNTAGFQTTFNGLNPNNPWTLFFADTVNGDQTTLNGWSLDITAVPEPVTLALVVFLVMLLALAGLRWAWRT